MRLGYACINTSLGKDGKFKTITVKSASKLSQDELRKKLKSITIDNLYNTLQIIKWNIKNNITMYRLSSNIVPLATHEIHNFDWKNDKDVIKICNQIKKLVEENDIRISMHPDQFVVINSPKENVFQSSLKNLEYHNDISNIIGCNTLILHIGGVYGDKITAKERFIVNFKRLPKDIQNKIVLENDDKSFNSDDVLDICQKLNIPFCIDLHHERVNPSYYSIENRLDEIITTWNGKTPKCHLSSGKINNADRSHADYITEEDYKWALDITKGKFDIMLESKQKELSIYKLINY